jgi:hypothetical protein
MEYNENEPFYVARNSPDGKMLAATAQVAPSHC